MTIRCFILRVCNCCIIMNVISTGCIPYQICSASCTVANSCCICHNSFRYHADVLLQVLALLLYQLHWLPVALVLLPYVSLSEKGVPLPVLLHQLHCYQCCSAATSCSATSGTVTMCNIITTGRKQLILPTVKQKVALLPSVFASSRTVRVT